jgi:aldehyde dehydrogenase (NAD+)
VTSDLSSTVAANDAPARPGPLAAPDASALVTALRETFASRRTRDLDWRIRQLSGIERLLDEREDEIVEALAEDLGRAPAEAWLADVASTKAEATFARKNVRKWAKRRRTSLSVSSLPGRAWYQYEPLGVVLVIGPWNYPVYLSLGPLVGALAAGNCAVIKPSEHAPASSRLLARLIPQYVDKDAVTVVEGDAQVTQELLALGLDHVFFTGGTEIGRLVMAAAAPQLTPVTLELGGKSPAIVTRNADIEVAARRIAWVKLMNSGQTCIAPDYVLVDRSVREKLIDALIETVRVFRAEEASSMLRIVNRRQFDRLAGLIEDTDGTIVLGGGHDAETLGIEPTIVVDPSPESAVMANEIFGPILPVLSVDSLDEAIDFVNARPKPLASYLFSKSGQERDKVLSEISSGGAVINHVAMHCMAPQLPFGGVGDSGMGAYHGKWGFEALSHRKAVLSKPSRPDLSMMYPPYTAKKLKLMRRFF